MIYKKLHISLIFSNLVKSKPLSTNPRMCNLYTKFVKILEICKQFSHNLVNEQGNIPRRGPMLIFLVIRNYAILCGYHTSPLVWVGDFMIMQEPRIPENPHING